MQRAIRGKAYVVGDDIDTDQIIPAQYLTYDPSKSEERRFFGKYAFAGLPEKSRGLPKGDVPFIQGETFTSVYKVVIAGKNFGCGSSREHATIALKEAGIEAAVAEFYSRIFFRNCVNGGYLIPFETSERLCEEITTGDEVEIDVSRYELRNLTRGTSFQLKPLGEILPILEAGNLFEYARKTGLIRK